MAFRWALAIASRSHGLTQSTARVTSFDSTVFIPTFLSSRCYALGQKPLPEEGRQRRHEEAKARAYEKWRLRYHSDPEFREKHKQRVRNRYADPKNCEKILRDFKDRYANDPQYRERRDLSSTKAYLERKSILVQDPKAYQLLRDQVTERVKAIYHNKAGYRWNQVLAGRLRLKPHYCDEVVWASHKPVLYPAKTNHTCATCGRKRYGGLKLWYVTSWCRLNWGEADGF